MNILLFGGAGFVGLNIAETLLARGHDVTIFDRRSVPDATLADLKALPGKLTLQVGDVTGPEAAAAVTTAHDTVILGAAITAGPAREARDPLTILSVNLLAQIPLLQAAREAGVRRVINLSSAAAYGGAGERFDVLTETTQPDPVGLYAITKYASEKVSARLGDLWGLEVANVRLSGIFGPWEHDTGVRDLLSPQYQILSALARGEPALLPRPGERDWTYAVDVGAALATVVEAPHLPRHLYNITTGRPLNVLAWGRRLATHFPGGVCRLATPDEAATINMHGATDRAPLSPEAINADLGWHAAYDLETSADHLAGWHQRSMTRGE